MYIKCQVCGSKCKNVNHLIFLGLYGAWWLSVTKKKKNNRVAVCQKPSAVIPADEYAWRCLNCFIGDYSYVSGYITVTLQQSTVICMYNRLPSRGRCAAAWTEVALRPGIYTGLLYKGNYLSYIWPVSYADIATLVHNYSWKRECTFSWCVLVSIWENLNQ